jgi:hypothetical protein
MERGFRPNWAIFLLLGAGAGIKIHDSYLGGDVCCLLPYEMIRIKQIDKQHVKTSKQIHSDRLANKMVSLHHYLGSCYSQLANKMVSSHRYLGSSYKF